MQDILAILIVAARRRVPRAPRLAAFASRRGGACGACSNCPSADSANRRQLVTISPIMSHAKAQSAKKSDASDQLCLCDFAPLREIFLHDHRDGSQHEATTIRRISRRPKAIASPPAVGLVCRARPRSALAAVARSVPRLGQRDHAAADAGGHGPRLLRAVRPSVSRRRTRWRPPTSSKCCGLWEGLGYYRRARQLHAAAKKVVAEHGGQFPRDVERAASSCPASAATRPARSPRSRSTSGPPILEANTIRLLSRLIAYRGDPLRTAGQRVLVASRRGDSAAKRRRPIQSGAHGARLARLHADRTEVRRSARLATLCAARAAGCSTKSRAPNRGQRSPSCAKRPSSSAKMAASSCGNAAQANAGPACGISRASNSKPKARCSPSKKSSTKVAAQTGITCAPGPLLKTMKHGVTRYRITLDCYEAAYVGGRVRLDTPTSPSAGSATAELAELPLSTDRRGTIAADYCHHRLGTTSRSRRPHAHRFIDAPGTLPPHAVAHAAGARRADAPHARRLHRPVAHRQLAARRSLRRRDDAHDLRPVARRQRVRLRRARLHRDDRPLRRRRRSRDGQPRDEPIDHQRSRLVAPADGDRRCRSPVTSRS